MDPAGNQSARLTRKERQREGFGGGRRLNSRRHSSGVRVWSLSLIRIVRGFALPRGEDASLPVEGSVGQFARFKPLRLFFLRHFICGESHWKGKLGNPGEIRVGARQRAKVWEPTSAGTGADERREKERQQILNPLQCPRREQTWMISEVKSRSNAPVCPC